MTRTLERESDITENHHLVSIQMQILVQENGVWTTIDLTTKILVKV